MSVHGGVGEDRWWCCREREWTWCIRQTLQCCTEPRTRGSPTRNRFCVRDTIHPSPIVGRRAVSMIHCWCWSVEAGCQISDDGSDFEIDFDCLSCCVVVVDLFVMRFVVGENLSSAWMSWKFWCIVIGRWFFMIFFRWYQWGKINNGNEKGLKCYFVNFEIHRFLFKKSHGTYKITLSKKKKRFWRLKPYLNTLVLAYRMYFWYKTYLIFFGN